jgi:hypothetical protein
MRLSMRWARGRGRLRRPARPCAVRHPAGRRDARPARRKRRGAGEIGFDGYAVGGLAVGEGQAAMFGVLDYAPDMLPEDRPRYLMGVGKPDDIVGAVARGIDMMDCVLPSRSGRTGQAFTRRGVVNIKNARHADDPRPLDEACTCPACRGYSRAYLHHVFRSGEIIASMLLTWHNLHYYQELMAGLRAAIAEDRFASNRPSMPPGQSATSTRSEAHSDTVFLAENGREICGFPTRKTRVFRPPDKKRPAGGGEQPAGQVGRDQGMPRPNQGMRLFAPRRCADQLRRVSPVRSGTIAGERLRPRLTHPARET